MLSKSVLSLRYCVLGKVSDMPGESVLFSLFTTAQFGIAWPITFCCLNSCTLYWKTHRFNTEVWPVIAIPIKCLSCQYSGIITEQWKTRFPNFATSFYHSLFTRVHVVREAMETAKFGLICGEPASPGWHWRAWVKVLLSTLMLSTAGNWPMKGVYLFVNLFVCFKRKWEAVWCQEILLDWNVGISQLFICFMNLRNLLAFFELLSFHL